MGNYDWQQQLEKRRQRTKYERIGTLVVAVVALGFFLWQIFYMHTPEYALEHLSLAMKNHDVATVEEYCDLDAISNQAYDDLTRDMFAQDEQLSTDSKVMFEQFYVKIKPQVIENTHQLLLAYVANDSWQIPGGDNILKGRQLGLDYEYLIERSQLRNTTLVKIESVDHNNDTALAKIQVKDSYTGTLFTLNLQLSKKESGWQVVKIVNYRDFLDFITPIQESGLLAYTKSTQDIIDKYNDIMDTQQTNFAIMTATSDGKLSSQQRETLADYIKTDIIPALEKRQQELDAIAITDGAQYLQSLRQQETDISIQQWQHFLTGIEKESLAELNTAEALHKNALDIQHRIDDVLKNTAVNKMTKTIP